MSSVVVLWLMLGYFCFSYLIRIVVFFDRYRSLDCCMVLLCKVFLQILVVVMYFTVIITELQARHDAFIQNINKSTH